MNTVDSELTLVRLVDTDGPVAMKLIYKRYVRLLTAVCSRYILNDEDVKDVLQESFLKIFASIGTFRYKGEGSLKAWMTRVVVNETLKFIGRTQRIDFTAISEDVAGIAEEEPEISDVPASVIHGFIRGLPDGYRMIFNLFVVEGKSHREIAALLGIRESTSASQLHRAKALLAARIKEYLNNTSI